MVSFSFRPSSCPKLLVLRAFCKDQRLLQRGNWRPLCASCRADGLGRPAQMTETETRTFEAIVRRSPYDSHILSLLFLPAWTLGSIEIFGRSTPRPDHVLGLAAVGFGNIRVCTCTPQGHRVPSNSLGHALMTHTQ